mgnify:CR=1 FL=1
MFIIQGWGTDQRVWPQWLKDSGTCYSKNLPQFQVVEQEFLQCFSVKQKKLTILGWSLGSMLALELAHKHGDKIAQLVLSRGFKTPSLHGGEQAYFNETK